MHLDSRFRLGDGIRIYLRGATALLRNEARGLHQNLFGNIAYCSKFILPFLGLSFGLNVLLPTSLRATSPVHFTHSLCHA